MDRRISWKGTKMESLSLIVNVGMYMIGFVMIAGIVGEA